MSGRGRRGRQPLGPTTLPASSPSPGRPHRFFVDPARVAGGIVHFPPDIADQMRRVLRMSPGDTVLVLDGAGWEYVTTIERLGREEAIGRVEVRRQATGEPRPRVVLYQALLRREKFEIVLQKATEVGVAGFVPVRTARSLIPSAEQVDARRQERWRRIVREAAEQSGRGLLPEVHAAADFAAAVRSAVAAGPTILLYEGQGCLALRQALRRMPPAVGSIALFVGPEGGFADEEVALAVERGIALVGLGPRILRSETAGIVGPALLLYELGAMEPCDGASPS